MGQLRDITPPDNKSTDAWPTATLHFIVEQPFRGVSTATIDITTPSGTTCDMHFVKGRRYLIYAVRDPESKQLFAGPCNRTTELEGAEEDLNYIRSLAQQGVTESIAGQVTHIAKPIPGVKIKARNERKSFETTADEEGNFSISLDGPGLYTITVLIPSSVSVLTTRDDQLHKFETTDTLTTVEYKIELGKSQCDYRQFNVSPIDLHATAEISGNVLTPSGRPVNKGYVYLAKGDDYRFNYTKIEATGSFKFENVPVGEYLLVLNPGNEAPGEDDPPYARAFYPNATDASGAAKIVVTEGARLEHLVLRVGPPLRARAVSGRVIWKEGGAAVDAQLSLYDGDRHVRTIEIDKKGSFSFKFYGDFKYAIQARQWRERSHKSDRVPITGKSTNLTLVLKPE